MGQAGLQQFSDREKWIFELWKALRDSVPGQPPLSFAQIVLLGRDQLKHWADNSGEINALHALEQHLLGGFPEKEAKEFLKKKGVSDPSMQDAILHSAQDVETGAGPKRYHVLSLGLLADTVEAERRTGAKRPLPRLSDCRPASWIVSRSKFLQSMPSATDERRIVRLARTPRFDELALKQICNRDPDANKEERRQIHGYTFIQDAAQSGWFVVHPRVREAILNVPKCAEKEEIQEQHQDWEKLWQDRSKQPTDDFAGLAWFHSYQLEWKEATKAWEALAQKARADSRMQDHHQLTDW